MTTLISGGRVIDPASRRDEVGDVWIDGDRIGGAGTPGSPGRGSTPDSRSVDRHIDARGCIVMAGGIDIHTHIGGGKISLARMLLQDQFPAAAPRQSEFLPAASVTADRYLEMGYTACFEPAVIPCNARSAHAEMADVRGLDTGGYCLLGNDDVLLRLIAGGAEQHVLNDYVAWMVSATQCIAVKVVNPGGINAFKFNTRTFDVDTPHPVYGVTPGQIIRVLCRAVHEIGLRHPLHVHCSNLGVPGNIESTLATIAAADGLPIHLTHAQFHAYEKSEKLGMASAASRLADAVNRNPNVTIDVGQIMFGQTVTISADTMHQYDNRPFATPRKSALLDIECEAGCGVVPFKYRRKQFVHSLQWAIGLELFLQIDNPAQVFLTTDHPNGGPFTAYPHLIRLLGDRSFRETALAEIHPDAAASSSLGGLEREFSLAEIATMTRAAPARILGLGSLGTLRPGATADVVIYPCRATDADITIPNSSSNPAAGTSPAPASSDPYDNSDRRLDRPADLEQMFARPKFVFKSGRLIRSTDPAVLADPIPSDLIARTHVADVHFDPASVNQFRDLYEQESLFALDRLRISDDEMADVIGSPVLRHDRRDTDDHRDTDGRVQNGPPATGDST